MDNHDRSAPSPLSRDGKDDLRPCPDIGTGLRHVYPLPHHGATEDDPFRLLLNALRERTQAG